jgi:hypothetical protein
MKSLLLFLLVAQAALATQYYVRKDGNNSNLGTSNTAGGAWLTILKAGQTMVAGDSVSVDSGTYLENVSITNNGTSGARITFLAGAADVYVRQFTIAKEYVTVQGFQISGSGASGSTLAINAGGNYATVRYNTFSTSTASIYQVLMPINNAITGRPSSTTIFWTRRTARWCSGEPGTPFDSITSTARMAAMRSASIRPTP